MSAAQRLPLQLRWRARAVQVILMAERLWSLLWPASGYLGLVLILSLFDSWQFVPAILHLAALATLLGLATWSLARRARRIEWPGLDEALRRLELDNDLKHRPLTAYADELAVGRGDQSSVRLWATYRAMLRRQFSNLHLSAPRSDLPARDPRAFRLLTVLVLLGGWALAGPNAGSLIRAGFVPDFGRTDDVPARIDAWITPPAYTGHAPVFLTNEQGANTIEGPLSIPQGAELTVRLSGSTAAPSVSGPLSDTAIDEIAPGTWGVTGVVSQSGEVTIVAESKQGAGPGASWSFELIPDTAPEIAFAPEPFSTPLGLMALPYTVQDDYGVTSVEAQLTLVPQRAEGAGFSDGFFNADGSARDDALFPANERAITALALPAPRPRAVEDDPTLDWREHPWAGREVLIQLSAADDGGSQSFSRPRALTLPARRFLNPLAAAVAEQRQILVQQQDAALDVALTLDALSGRADLFIEDLTAYLGIRTAVWRLASNPHADELRDTYHLLWDIALRLEDGDLSLTLDRIRELEQALLDALSRGADNSEIAELLAQLREAVSEYLAALEQQEAQPSMADATEMMNTDDLGSLLDRIEEMAMMGSPQAAREMLRGLADLLAQLENSTPMQSGEGMSAEERAMADALEGLSGVLGSQRQLLDETFRGAQGESGSPYARTDPWADWGGWPPPEDWPYGHDLPDDAPADPSGSSPRAPSELAQDQMQLLGALRGILEALLEGGVDVPGTMGDAQREMDGSGDALADGSLSGAVPPQEQAIEALRQALDTLSEQLLSQMAERMGGQRPGQASGRDPLGRTSPSSGPDFGDSVDVPTEREMQRAREILEELRRRAGERDRPEIELDYLERLLRRF